MSTALRQTALRPFSPFAEELRDSLYETYDRYRNSEPVHWGAPVTAHHDGCWYLFTYREGEAVLKDPRFGVEPPGATAAPDGAPDGAGCPFAEMRNLWMLFRDPPFHSRVRGAMARRFNVALARRLRGEIGRIARELLAEVRGSGWMDVVDDYALRLPLRVLAASFDLPRSEVPRLETWALALLAQLAAESRAESSPRTGARADAAAVELGDYFRDWLRDRRRAAADSEPDPWRLAADGEELDENELVASLGLLLWTAYETTANLIANGTLALLAEPSQRALLPSAGGPVSSRVVEELVRYDCPAQMTLRFAHRDVEMGQGARRWSVRRGEPVVVLLGAANRDPERFADPARLDLERKETRHLGFGAGAHFCLGTELARIEGQEALGALFSELPDLRLETLRPEWVASADPALIRRLRSLHVSFSAS